MSEPITKGLRLYADTMLSEYSPILFHIKELCDNIDDIHTSLEQENERLQEKLDNACNSIDDSYDSGYNVGYAAGKGSSDFTSIDNWLAEHGWAKLPVDADGVLICVGDELWSDDGMRFKVKELHFDNGKWAVYAKDKTGIGFYVAFEIMHHVKPDTWESIISDAMRAGRADVAVDVMPLIKRCKALAGEDE